MNEPTPYTGIENLEVMREAANYNRYLQSLVERHAAGARRVIDFGAGSGTFAIPCAAAGFDLTAVEPDEHLRALLAAARIDAVADVAALPNEAFHFAYTLNVLEHIEDDVEALRVLRAKLVPRGRLFVYVPAFPVLYTSMDLRVRHVRRYTRATLRGSLEGLAARLVAEAIDEAKAARLAQVFDDLVEACQVGDALLVAERDFALLRRTSQAVQQRQAFHR